MSAWTFFCQKLAIMKNWPIPLFFTLPPSSSPPGVPFVRSTRCCSTRRAGLAWSLARLLLSFLAPVLPSADLHFSVQFLQPFSFHFLPLHPLADIGCSPPCNSVSVVRFHFFSHFFFFAAAVLLASFSLLLPFLTLSFLLSLPLPYLASPIASHPLLFLFLFPLSTTSLPPRPSCLLS